MPINESVLAIAAKLVGQLLQITDGPYLLGIPKNKGGDEIMRLLGQRVKALAQAMSDVS